MVGPMLVAQALWGLIALRHGRLLAYLAGKLEGVRLLPEKSGRILFKSGRDSGTKRAGNPGTAEFQRFRSLLASYTLL